MKRNNTSSMGLLLGIGAAVALCPTIAQGVGGKKTRQAVVAGAHAVTKAVDNGLHYAVQVTPHVAVGIAPRARAGQTVVGVFPHADASNSRAIGLAASAEGRNAHAAGLLAASAYDGRAAAVGNCYGRLGAVSLTGLAFSDQGLAIGPIAHAQGAHNIPAKGIGIWAYGYDAGIGVVGVSQRRGLGLLVGAGNELGVGGLLGVASPRYPSKPPREYGALNLAFKAAQGVVNLLP